MTNYKEISQAWIEDLKRENVYLYTINSQKDCSKYKKFSRVWKRIFKAINKRPQDIKAVFEVGFGGGIQLIPFALNDVEIAGIEVSPDVFQRAENFLNQARKICKKSFKSSLILGDFFEKDLTQYKDYFDLVFHFGVIEHFLNDEERILFLEKTKFLTKKGGYIISVVPSGVHRLRQLMKDKKLGGYNIPEIDYSEELMKKEFQQVGLSDIIILTHNFFGYFLFFNNPIAKLFYLFSQVVDYNYFLSKLFPKECTTLIGIAKKQ
jgi:2-polyprenyl-3-methyl-5-hydroxy-6-metoxy-1,4-benzoquinol methylase